MKISACKFPDFEDCKYCFSSGVRCIKCSMWHRQPTNYSVAGNLANAYRGGR